jgi:hypothetical protein
MGASALAPSGSTRGRKTVTLRCRQTFLPVDQGLYGPRIFMKVAQASEVLAPRYQLRGSRTPASVAAAECSGADSSALLAR